MFVLEGHVDAFKKLFRWLFQFERFEENQRAIEFFDEAFRKYVSNIETLERFGEKLPKKLARVKKAYEIYSAEKAKWQY